MRTFDWRKVKASLAESDQTRRCAFEHNTLNSCPFKPPDELVPVSQHRLAGDDPVRRKLNMQQGGAVLHRVNPDKQSDIIPASHCKRNGSRLKEKPGIHLAAMVVVRRDPFVDQRPIGYVYNSGPVIRHELVNTLNFGAGLL
jgi:hypothetical protein